MKGRMKFTVVTLCLIMVVSVLVTLSATGASPVEDTPPPPSVDRAPFSGPDVGPEPTGKPVTLAPLVLSPEMRAANVSVVSDDFNSCVFNDVLWDFINPLNDVTLAMEGTYTEDAWITFTIPKGSDHDIWLYGNFSPRIVQTVDNVDFDVATKFETPVVDRFQMQGILVEQNAKNFLRFEFYGDNVSTTLIAASFTAGITTPLAVDIMYKQDIDVAGVAPLYMRVQRQGAVWNQYYSYDGDIWLPAGSFDRALTVRKVGVYGSNTGGAVPPAHYAAVDYFFNMDSPIVPEDGVRNSLDVTVSPVGGGSVTKLPNKATYECDEMVTVTPQANAGWAFAGWSGPDAGKLINNNNGTWSIKMDGAKQVTALFTQTTVTLQINVIGQGSVDQDPLPPYAAGTEVTLTPVPNPGWEFLPTGWEGPNAGEVVDNGDGTYSLTLNGNKQLTARFTGAQYYLTVNVNPPGKGDVIVIPDNQDPYTYGEMPSLRPVPIPGWGFAGWSGPDAGDLINNGNGTWSVQMDADKSVTANFAQFRIYLPAVIRKR